MNLEKVVKSLTQRGGQHKADKVSAYAVANDCKLAGWMAIRWMTENVSTDDGMSMNSAQQAVAADVVNRLSRSYAVHSQGVEAYSYEESPFPSYSIQGVISSEDGDALLYACGLNSTKIAPLFRHKLEAARYASYVEIQLQLDCQPENIKNALYVAVCVNTGRIYTEVVERSPHAAAMLRRKAASLVSRMVPPAPVTDKPDDFRCRKCPSASFCKDFKLPPVHCRSCMFAEGRANGDWFCQLDKTVIPIDKQRSGCEKHMNIPEMVDGEVVYSDESAGVIEYQMRDGTKRVERINKESKP